MKTTLTLTFALCCTIAAQASYIPSAFDGIRAAIVDQQVAISNAPPFDAATKKELNALKVALKTIDKPSTSLKSDLTALSKVVAGINKSASNVVFSFEFASAISNFVAILGETNDVLEADLAAGTNNFALKQKAQDALDAAAASLAAIQPETDLNGAAKNLGAVLKQFGTAAKAVAAAVKAKPAPVPAPKPGTVVVEAAGHVYVLQCVGPSRPPTVAGFSGTNGLFYLTVNISSGQGPGVYPAAVSVIKAENGTTNVVTLQVDNANITASSAKVVAGNFSGTGTFGELGGVPSQVSVTVRFNGKYFFSIPGH
jgi:hypothetical protein